MRIREVGAVAVMVGLILAPTAAASLRATPRTLVDQSDLPANFATAGASFSGLWGFVQRSSPLAQTFVAGRSGHLTQVVLPINGCNQTSDGGAPLACASQTPTVAVAISATAGGRPNGVTIGTPVTVAVPLATESTSATAITVRLGSSTRVVKGKTYAIVVTALEAWPPASYFWAHFRSDRYRAGLAFARTSDAGWAPVRRGQFTTTGPADFGFATYVTP